MYILDSVEQYQEEAIAKFKKGVYNTLDNTFKFPILKYVLNYAEEMLEDTYFFNNEQGQLVLRVELESGCESLKTGTFEDNYGQLIDLLIQDFFANAEYPRFEFKD